MEILVELNRVLISLGSKLPTFCHYGKSISRGRGREVICDQSITALRRCGLRRQGAELWRGGEQAADFSVASMIRQQSVRPSRQEDGWLPVRWAELSLGWIEFGLNQSMVLFCNRLKRITVYLLYTLHVYVIGGPFNPGAQGDCPACYYYKAGPDQWHDGCVIMLNTFADIV